VQNGSWAGVESQCIGGTPAAKPDLLDAIWPDTPVALFSRDYHAKLCNSKALSIIGIDESSPDPAGGSIERDHHGRPTGVLYETATELVINSPFSPPAPRL
jgi:predicted amidohydrolase YtcJ